MFKMLRANFARLLTCRAFYITAFGAFFIGLFNIMRGVSSQSDMFITSSVTAFVTALFVSVFFGEGYRVCRNALSIGRTRGEVLAANFITTAAAACIFHALNLLPSVIKLMMSRASIAKSADKLALSFLAAASAGAVILAVVTVTQKKTVCAAAAGAAMTVIGKLGADDVFPCGQLEILAHKKLDDLAFGGSEKGAMIVMALVSLAVVLAAAAGAAAFYCRKDLK